MRQIQNAYSSERSPRPRERSYRYVRTFSSLCPRSSRKYSSATPITHIILSHDLGADLTYLLLPSCRPVRNLEQIAAAAAQQGSQDSPSLPVEPVSRQIPRSPLIPFSQPLADLGGQSWHGNSQAKLTPFFFHICVSKIRRCLGSGKQTRERASMTVSAVRVQ